MNYNNVQRNNTRVNNFNGGRGNVQVNNNVRVNNNVQNNHVNVNNKELNRNINVNNSRVNDFRGRNDRPPQVNQVQQGQRGVQGQQGVQNHAQFNGQNGPHTFGRSEGNFNANVSSQRGQTSRTQMTQPVHTYTPASRGGGGSGHPSGGGGSGRPSGGGGHPGGGRHP